MSVPLSGQPLFFFAEDDEDAKKSMRERRAPLLNTNLSRVSSRASDFSNFDDVLLFPVENSHAYSYAHLSPNSLALRLNVLKRSLEILKERPGWVKLMKHTEEANNSDDSGPPSPKLPPKLAEPPKRGPGRSLLYQTRLRTDTTDHLDKLKLSSNASSAALSALFRPKMSRSDSLPVSRSHSPEPKQRTLQGEHPDGLDVADDIILTDDLKDIIELLEKDSSKVSSKSEIATTLHDLSLTLSQDDIEKKQDILKRKLLFALATPFVESSAMTASPWGEVPPISASTSAPLSALPNASTTALNLLSSMQQAHGTMPQANPGNRPFHAMSAGKHNSPQSIITLEADYPWSFKAANDLACLMFGVSKSMIRNLTLMDLIAPQFRNFVTDRLMKAITGAQDVRAAGTKNIIFAGEIIAISRHAEGDFAWTSIWAQMKGNLIICMFEQITCDAFDVVLLCPLEDYAKESYTISSVTEIAGKLITKLDANNIKQLRLFSETLDADLRKLASSHSEEDSFDFKDSELVNAHRYYTIQLDGDDNIPCALTSYPLEKDDEKYEIKLKIHSMPYIAGMFVVAAHSHSVLSCNKAIAKNLFGISPDQILDHSINTIIPEFTKILQTGLDDYEERNEPIRIVPGLVLPEHFFRKYHARIEHNTRGLSTDELFFSSRGIHGLHRDGKMLFVDVQLRFILPEVFVLWVTYSRHFSKNITKQLGKLSTNSATVSPNGSTSQLTRSKSANSLSSSRVDLPSQMKLFPDHESEILELGLSSSDDIIRKNSTRAPKRASTFALPVNYISDGSMSGRLQQQHKQGSSGSLSHPTSRSSSKTEHGLLLTRPRTEDTSDTEAHNLLHYKQFSEAEMLDLENKELEAKQKSCNLWPTVIGAKKRSKRFDEFKNLKSMGEGAYGKVVLAQHKDDPNYKIIVKCIDKQRILVDTWVRDRQLGTIPSEIQVMATLNHEPHPNIMRIIDYFEDPNYYYLETPIFGNPPAIDLFDYIEVKNNMSELDCQLIFKQVTLAIYHLHKHGIVHRDIKDENIIVNEFGVVKLIDFGSAGYVKLGPFDVFVGTIDYASPEVLRGEKYEGKPQDIWALGILLYTMIYKENPFYNVDEIMEGELRVPYVVSQLVLKLIRQILERDVDKRPTITDVADSDWLDI